MKYGKMFNNSQLKGDDPFEGETIEQKVRRIVENNEPIKDGAPIIYTERKDGVIPAYNVRTDRFDVAIMAMDAVNKAKIAKSMNNLGQKPEGTEPKGTEPKGTEPKGNEPN